MSSANNANPFDFMSSVRNRENVPPAQQRQPSAWKRFIRDLGFDSKNSGRGSIAQNGQRNGDANAEAEKARQRELKEKEEEELQLALAISMSEAEAKEKGRQSGLYHQFGNSSSTSAPPKSAPAEPKLVNGSNAPSEYSYIYRGVAQDSALPAADEDEDLDPALSRYLDKRYWEQRQAARDVESMSTLNNGNIRATAPPPSEMSFSTSSDNPTINDYAYSTFNNGALQPQAQATVPPNGVSNGFDFNQASSNVEQKMAGLSLTPVDEVEQTASYCKNLREQVEIMDNRMRSNLMRGRSVVNDSAIHSLFTKLTSVHADVLERMNKLDEDRELYESMQDKLGYIQEARQALTSLREEHIRQRQERLQEEARLRMQQMQSKLEEIRHKKYENLMEQRQMALQRLQQEEQRLQEARQKREKLERGEQTDA